MSVYNRSRRVLQEVCRDTRRWNPRALHGMKRPVQRMTNAFGRSGGAALAVVAFAALAALAAGGCGHDIGDECKSSVDCDPNGTRSCDLSQPGGYCTVQGCDETSCPSGSACVRIFPMASFLPKMCHHLLEDLDGKTNDCLADEVCLDNDHCARQSFEQRYCAKTCDPSGNMCRGGYMCRFTGDLGSMPLSSDPTQTTYFCAPAPPAPKT
jgi:hypothetical protein